MKRTAILRSLGVVSLAIIAAACSASPDGSGDDTKGTQVIENLDITIIDHDQLGIPNFIVGDLGRVALQPGLSALEIERALFPALQAAEPALRLSPGEMVLSRANTDQQGDLHFHLQQYKNGLMVLGAEVAVHVRGDVVTSVNGSARADVEAELEAKIDPATAMDLALSHGEGIEDREANNEPELAYRPAGDKLDLVYLVEVTGMRPDTTPVRDTVVVSARDGSVLDRIAHIHTAKNREVHNLNHGTTLPGPVARTETGAANTDAVVNNNFDRLGSVYDAYSVLFKRDSYDNLGAKLISSVHYSNNYVNAYWDGTQMVYGDGDGVNASNLANSLDVTGHELTHAVTEKTSGLIYSGESGGLNEAWSDALGNVVEWYVAGQPATASANNFLVGEDVWTPGTAGDALRYMCDPLKDGASLDFYTSTAGTKDVHYSSGIANLAFCLLVKGGTHPRGKSTVNVTGIGMAKAAQIWYKAELIMTSGTNFAGAKTATEQAATQLGYSAADVASVTAAWQAVGVGSSGGGGGGGTCAHDKCTTGVALSSTCNSVVSAVCASDAYCCSTSWDSTCVREDRTIGKSLVCSESKGTCTHTLCTTGTALKSGCDSTKAACVSKICAADSFCCSTAGSWDALCVAKVASVCGYNCN